MLNWFLFETWLGDKLLALFERLTGLTVEPLGNQGLPGDQQSE